MIAPIAKRRGQAIRTHLGDPASIGRSLRAVIDLEALGERQIRLDCDVIQARWRNADGIYPGAWVALKIATDALVRSGSLARDPVTGSTAAVSCGIFEGDTGSRPRLSGGSQR